MLLTKKFFLSLSFSLLAMFSTVHATETITIDGSSTVFPVTEAVAEEFQIIQKGKVRVTVGISGTGGGFKKFCRGETDLQDASRPISQEEMNACKQAGIKYQEFPIAFDAITIVVNPKNTWATDITIAELKMIWEPSARGKITKWNQVRSTWPDAPLKLFGAGADSGTFDYFTEAVMGKAKSSRGDYTASEDDNTLVLGMSSDINAMGYLPFAYFEPNQSKLKALAVIADSSTNKAVLPNAQTIEDGTYYPFSRPLFIYVSSKGMARPPVKDFVNFYLKNVAVLGAQVKYVPLPPKAYEIALKNFLNEKLGTAFGGQTQVGLNIEETLQKQTKL
jgi:phosphate transport system substrate-binding protein